MQIILENIGKRYNTEWIFRKVNIELKPNIGYAILGQNGSGKSTLLQVIAGNILPNEGKVIYKNENTEISSDSIYKHISFSSPYLELTEEYNLEEMISFHHSLKPLQNKIDLNTAIEKMELNHARKKQLKNFSSGMKQRVKLGLAIMSDTSILLLDEPTSNLDKKAIEWYKNLIAEFSINRTIIVCSNALSYEYELCKETLEIEKFKIK